MSAEENKKFIRRYLEAINGKEKPPVVVDQFVSDADKLLKQHIAGFEAGFPRYELVPEDIFAEGDKVALRFTFCAGYGGGFMDIPARGQKVAMPGIIIYKIANGKIVDHWMQVDMQTLTQQLGAKS
jgi:predicted ester cyclase